SASDSAVSTRGFGRVLPGAGPRRVYEPPRRNRSPARLSLFADKPGSGSQFRTAVRNLASKSPGWTRMAASFLTPRLGWSGWTSGRERRAGVAASRGCPGFLAALVLRRVVGFRRDQLADSRHWQSASQRPLVERPGQLCRRTLRNNTGAGAKPASDTSL